MIRKLPVMSVALGPRHTALIREINSHRLSPTMLTMLIIALRLSLQLNPNSSPSTAVWVAAGTLTGHEAEAEGATEEGGVGVEAGDMDGVGDEEEVLAIKYEQ